MDTPDSVAALKLLKDGCHLPFRVLESRIRPALDEAEFGLRVDLIFADEDVPDEDAPEVAQSGALAFLYIMGALAFSDARTRGHSDIEFVEGDEFGLGDLVTHLRLVDGSLELSLDYLRGRRIKTDVCVRSDGTATIATRGRGKSIEYWLARLRGQGGLRAVG